uniref:Uncharacterized protein n=1 Tax=Glossina palpalis gambiensis TaxID=67801 RepID=A0A1B0AZ98_9MUSC
MATAWGMQRRPAVVNQRSRVLIIDFKQQQAKYICSSYIIYLNHTFVLLLLLLGFTPPPPPPPPPSPSLSPPTSLPPSPTPPHTTNHRARHLFVVSFLIYSAI